MKKCNWMPDSECDNIDKNTEAQCDQECHTSPSFSTSSTEFCGYCSSDVHCVEIPGISSESDCDSKEACMLLSGEIVFVSKVISLQITVESFHQMELKLLQCTIGRMQGDEVVH